MSMFYIGGELAQSRLGLPKSLTGVFQGLLLFALLACDTLIAYRIRWKPAHVAPVAPASPAGIDDAPLNPVVASTTLPAREGT
jgi:simple sugar transport system permease protein